MKENSTFKETTIEDYLPKVCEAFPDIPKEDIKVILNYGWRLIYIATLMGCDVLITSTSNKFWFYIGNLCKDSLRHFEYYKKQLIRKMLFIYKRTKPEESTTYYLALTKEEYEEMIKPKRGRKKCKYTYSNKLIFKYKDACKLYYSSYPCIVMFDHILDVGFRKMYKTITINNPKIIEVKQASTFKDVLVDNNEYDLI